MVLIREEAPLPPKSTHTHTHTYHPSTPLARAPCSQPSVSYGTNAVKTTAKGYRVLDFADGGRVEVHFPTYYLRGEAAGGSWQQLATDRPAPAQLAGT